MPRILDSMQSMRLTRAIQNSRRNQRANEIRQKMAAAQNRTNWEKEKEQEAFHDWDIAFQIVRTLENLKEKTAPKNFGDAWSPVFQKVLNMLPEARAYEREKWLDYIQVMQNLYRKGGD